MGAVSGTPPTAQFTTMLLTTSIVLPMLMADLNGTNRSEFVKDADQKSIHISQINGRLMVMFVGVSRTPPSAVMDQSTRPIHYGMGWQCVVKPVVCIIASCTTPAVPWIGPCDNDTPAYIHASDNRQIGILPYFNLPGMSRARSRMYIYICCWLAS